MPDPTVDPNLNPDELQRRMAKVRQAYRLENQAFRAERRKARVESHEASLRRHAGARLRHP